MRHLIVLPGNNVSNKLWGERAISRYSEYFDSLYMQEYSHWESGASMDMTVEEEKLRAHVATLAPGTDIFVVAKSAGSILCLSATEVGFLRPVYCAFFGMPIDWAMSEVFLGNWSAIDNFSVPTTAFHNTHDPIAPYEYVRKIVNDRMKKVSLVTTEGTDHAYDDFDLYDKYLLTLIAR